MKIKDLLSALPEFYQFVPGSGANPIKPLHLKTNDQVNWSFRKKFWTVDELNLDVAKIKKNPHEVDVGDLFVAISGTDHDGHTDLTKVIEKNPVAIVYEKEVAALKNYSGIRLKVNDSKKSFALLQARFYGEPTLKMWTLGITGTNGKTTSVYMAEHLLNTVGLTCGVLGTIDHHLQDSVWPTSLTTPDAAVLQQRLEEMKNLGAKAIAMEVTSHALKQRRVSGVHFNTVLFTNLSRDHLDYHPTMQDYFKSKELLFTECLWSSMKFPLFAVVNHDDQYGRKLQISGRAYIWTYGKSPQADFYYQIKEETLNGTQFELQTPFGNEKDFHLNMIGPHNVSNAVGVLASLSSLGLDMKILKERLSHFKGVSGRLQKVANNCGLFVFVDYAHTPDGLENALRSLHRLKPQSSTKSSKLRVLFGCGGDRDKGKRALMAAVSEKWADQIILTSDNPRSEDPNLIIENILKGFVQKKVGQEIFVEPDRRAAIGLILKQSSAGDIILIAGKGHENFQIVGTEKKPFSDFLITQNLLSEKG